MNYNIKLHCSLGKPILATVNAFDDSGGLDFYVDFDKEESIESFVKRIEGLAKKELENKVVTEKVRIPNIIATDKDSTKSAIEKQIKVIDDTGYYDKQVFTGKKGSGKSSRGGAYMGANNLEIYKIFKPDEETEVWFYKKRGECNG